MAANLYDVINTIVAGGLLGTLGQGIRMAIGLKKLSDANVNKGADDKEDVNGTRLMVSLFIGFVAGALFLIIKGAQDIGKQEFVFSVIAAGYSGADFIEGLFNTYISKIGSSGNTASTAASSSSTNALPQNYAAASSFASNERDDEPTTNL